MANIFLREPTYITVQEVKDTSSKSWLIALTDDEIKILIAKAEDLVDWYIIKYCTPYDEEQELIFPILDEDWNALIPDDITKATFYCVEQEYVNWDLVSSATSSWSWAVKSEKAWHRSVAYDVESEVTTNNLKYLWMPEQAENLLKKYRNIFIKTVI